MLLQVVKIGKQLLFLELINFSTFFERVVYKIFNFKGANYTIVHLVYLIIPFLRKLF